MDLRSCPHCGRIHDRAYKCEQKLAAEKRHAWNKRHTQEMTFRRTNRWTVKSREIRKRDKNLCLCCLAKMKGTQSIVNSKDLSVHHIIPIVEDWSKRLADDNLITVCSIHHEMCEANQIEREKQRALLDVYYGAEDTDEVFLL